MKVYLLFIFFWDIVIWHKIGSYLRLNEIEKSSLMINFITISYLFNYYFLDLSVSIFGFIYYDI